MNRPDAQHPHERLGRLGFRRWYERELVTAHGWLVACLLALILLASGLELLSVGDGVADFGYDVALILLSIGLAWTGWKRYAATMLRAEHVGHQATCPRCGHYGFRAALAERGRIRATCPKCGAGWGIEPPG